MFITDPPIISYTPIISDTPIISKDSLHQHRIEPVHQNGERDLLY